MKKQIHFNLLNMKAGPASQPAGCPSNHQFSSGFIRFSGWAHSLAPNSENPNGFLIILSPFGGNDLNLLEIHQVL